MGYHFSFAEVEVVTFDCGFSVSIINEDIIVFLYLPHAVDVGKVDSFV